MEEKTNHPWYRSFSWCLAISLLLAVIVIGCIVWYGWHLGSVTKQIPDAAGQLAGALLSAGALYLLVPFFILFVIAACCNVAALIKWNRWLSLATAVLYVQAGAILPAATLLTFIPACLCLASMGWCVKTNR